MSKRARTRENSQNQSLPFAVVIRGHSRQFALQMVPSVPPNLVRNCWNANDANVRECSRIKHRNDLNLIVRRNCSSVPPFLRSSVPPFLCSSVPPFHRSTVPP